MSTPTSTPWLYQNTSLGHDFFVQVPFHTTDEYDALAGRTGAWREDLAAQCCYGGPNSLFRKNLGIAIAAKLGEPIPLDTSGPAIGKDTDGKDIYPVLDTKKYKALVIADGKLTEEEINTIAQEVATAMPPISVPKNTRGGGAKLPKELLNGASNLIAQLAAAGSSVEDWFARVIVKYPSAPNPGSDPSDESVARVIQYVQREEAKSLLSI